VWKCLACRKRPVKYALASVLKESGADCVNCSFSLGSSHLSESNIESECAYIVETYRTQLHVSGVGAPKNMTYYPPPFNIMQPSKFLQFYVT
jgi:hypothetical protein